MSPADIFWFGVLALASFGIGRASMTSRIKSEVQAKEAAETISASLHKLFDHTLSNLRDDSVLLPSLARWADSIQKALDNSVVGSMLHKPRPARKAAVEVQEARATARESKKELRVVLNRLDFYESLAPWLGDYVDMSVQECLDAIHEEIEFKTDSAGGEDPVSKYVPRAEWQALSVAERNQLALDRYADPARKRSLWRVGIDYERFVGFEYEQEGYSVEYHGATQGKADLGIDLVCRKGSHTLVVQCKRLSPVKEIPVRENVVAQVFGAAEYYRMNKGKHLNVIPVLITSYVLSEQARAFADYLNVAVKERHEQRSYPMIKCNVSNRSGEKIYHLPMDQQYDNVIIGDNDGEFYAQSVQEAEAKGFRRAYRWKGGETGSAA